MTLASGVCTPRGPLVGVFYEELAWAMADVNADGFNGYISHDFVRPYWGVNPLPKFPGYKKNNVNYCIAQTINPGSHVGRDILNRSVSSKILFKYIDKFGVPDVVVVQDYSWSRHILRQLKEIQSTPHVVMFHSSDIMGDNMSNGTINLINELTHDASDLWFVSSALKNGFSRHFGNNMPGRIIPNLLGEDFEADISNEIERENKLICVSPFIKNKAVDILVKSFGEIKNKNINIVLVGRGPEEENIRLLIKNLKLENRVEIVSYLDKTEIASLMKTGQALVHPSLKETFGIVLIEAMACGLPVLATYCGGPEDIVTSELGILVPPGDAQGLSRAIDKMIESIDDFDRAEIARHSREKYSRRRIGEEMVGVLEGILTDR